MNTPPALPLSAKPNTLAMLASGEFAYDRRAIRVATILAFIVPAASALLLWITLQSLVHVLITAEALLVSALAAAELAKVRETARRNAAILICVNALFLVMYGIAIEHLLLVLFAGLSLCACLPLLRPRRQLPWAVPLCVLSMALCVIGTVGAGLWVYQASVAASAYYKEGAYRKAYDALERVGVLIPLCGGSSNDRALLGFRRAELAFRCNELARARHYLATAQALAQGMVEPAERVGNRQSLAYVINNRAIPDLASALYMQQAWGMRYPFPQDPLEAAAMDEEERLVLGW